MKRDKLIKSCNFITFITALYGGVAFFKILLYCYLMGKQDGGFTITSALIAQAINAMGVMMICLLFFVMVENVKKGLVFTVENEKLLRVFGVIIIILGFLSDFIGTFSDSGSSFLSSGLLILVGFCLIFISLIFKIGIGMREEQELTV